MLKPVFLQRLIVGMLVFLLCMIVGGIVYLKHLSGMQKKVVYFAEKCYDIHQRTLFGGRCHNSIIPKGFSLCLRILDYLSNSRYIIVTAIIIRR